MAIMTAICPRSELCAVVGVLVLFKVVPLGDPKTLFMPILQKKALVALRFRLSRPKPFSRGLYFDGVRATCLWGMGEGWGPSHPGCEQP